MAIDEADNADASRFSESASAVASDGERSDGSRPRTSDGGSDRFGGDASLGFDPTHIEQRLHQAETTAMDLAELVTERTVTVDETLDEDEFFSTDDGHTTVTNRYDLEKAVPLEQKRHFVESDRYWVNKPYAFVVIFHSEKENEKKYFLIEPYCNAIETELREFLSEKLRATIKYSDEDVKRKTDDGRRAVIDRETRRLLGRYDLFEAGSDSTSKRFLETVKGLFGANGEDDHRGVGGETIAGESTVPQRQLQGLQVRPEPVVLTEDPETLSEYQVEKLLYLLKRNFIGYERIDGIKHDINVEDISVDGYNSPVFVYHTEYEQIITNVHHGEEELDDFVVKLAQRSGKGISKRLPQVDATLPDGSRAQLTLGTEVSDHGTNYTIRQFKDVPFTPIDLINWNTYSLDEMAFLWLCIENHKSLIFAGGTASGKTTSLNAISLFIPANAKIVSIEDTREVELPQRNWIASITRPSFSEDTTGDIDEFDLLEAALRQRPDYIVMGEIRGEEGRTLFQVMSTGHTTYTTFHADSVDEVLKRFTTDPINVSKTMFTALDLVSIQTQTRVQGRKVRRNKSLTEINHYEAEHDEINVQDVYQWQAETDEYLKMGDSNTLDEIVFDRGWNRERLQSELFQRRVILAYLIKNGLNTYAEVAATVQAFINDPETVLTLIANGQLEASLDDLREMESVQIDVDPEKETLVPRPGVDPEVYNLAVDILDHAEESLFEEYRGKVPSGLASATADVEPPDKIEVSRSDVDEFDFTGESGSPNDLGWDDIDELAFDDTDTTATTDAPSWLSDDGTETNEELSAADEPSNVGETSPDGPELEVPTGSSDESPTTTVDTTEDSGHDTVELGELQRSTLGETAEADRDDRIDADSTDDVDISDDIDSLFSGMSDTLESLERSKDEPEERAESPDTDSTPSDESAVDTSDFDAMFPDRDLESIFSSSSREASPSNEPNWGLGTHRSPGRSSESPGSTVGGPTRTSTTEGNPNERNADVNPDNSIFGSAPESVFRDGDTRDETNEDEPEFDDVDDEDDSIFEVDRANSLFDADDRPDGEDARASGGDADDGAGADDSEEDGV